MDNDSRVARNRRESRLDGQICSFPVLGSSNDDNARVW